MAGICDYALAIGVTLFGYCETEGPQQAPTVDRFGQSETGIFQFKPAPPPPPAPVVIVQPAPEPRPVPAPEPVRAPPPPMPSAWPSTARYEQAAIAAKILDERRQSAWKPVVVEAAFSPAGPDEEEKQIITTLKLEDSDYEEGKVESSLPVKNDRRITTDRYITGIVENGVNSQVAGEAGGQLIIQVSRDIYGYHDKNPLIPKGSRIVCEYESLERHGETRLPVVCKRVLRAEDRAELYGIEAPAGDVMGRAGVPGEIDNRIWERYGSAFVVSAIAAAAAAAGGAAGDDSTVGAAGTELAENLGEISAKVLEQTVNLAPIATIAQGSRVTIMPRNDWVLKEPVVVSAN